MKASFRILWIVTLVVLAGAGILGVSGGPVEAQASWNACYQRCLGRNLAMATCDRYCSQRHKRGKN